MVKQVMLSGIENTCYFCEMGEYDDCTGCALGDTGFAGTGEDID